jgi:large subunit ribosomal protein L5
MLRLKEKYKKEVIPALKEKFNHKNSMSVPGIRKIVINTGFGREIVSKKSDESKKLEEHILKELALITGQEPSLRKARKSISSFKLRAGTAIGAAVTLRGDKMYDFLERLIYITLPRTRDFNGLDKKLIDNNGNLSIGFKEHTPFPEISAEREKSIFGLEVNVVTDTKDREEALALFKLLGFPFKT